MKVINDLLGYENLKIVQDDEGFCFSLDSVLLANFVSIKKDARKLLDLGSGSAPMPLIIAHKYIKKDLIIYGIELQKQIYEMAVESVRLNNLDDKITLINDDIKELNKHFSFGSFDVIISNPPYFKV